MLCESAPTKLGRKLWDFLTKTVPDGVHDGEDEVKAVADVESDQDVVEAVAHLFPMQDNSYEGIRTSGDTDWHLVIEVGEKQKKICQKYIPFYL